MRRLRALSAIFLAACSSQSPHAAFEDLTRARHFSYHGVSYLAEFNRFAADKEQTLEDGTVIRAFGIYESVDVSRGEGGQFVNTEGDRLEAQAAAIAYCAKIGLTPPAGERTGATFSEAYAVQNAEWQFTGICTLPPSDPRAS